MPLSNKLRRIALLAEPDVQRTLEREAARIAGHDGARYDERSATMVFTRGGTAIWQPRAERIGDWVPDLGMFYWWWHGVKFGEQPRSKLDVVYREGENYGLTELTSDSIGVEAGEDAELLAHLSLQLLRADGLYRVRHGDRVSYFALFGAPASEAPRGGDSRPAWLTSDPHEQPTHERNSFRPAATAWSVAPPPMAPPRERAALGVKTVPPLDVSPDDGFAHVPDTRGPAIPPAPRPMTPPPPQVSVPVRDPAREIFMPVAQIALNDVALTTPGFGQALLVVRVEMGAGGKHRFFVQLVAKDAEGDLVSLDPSRTLLEAVTKMIADDARDGNGRWSKLAARLRPTARGASVDLHVV